MKLKTLIDILNTMDPEAEVWCTSLEEDTDILGPVVNIEHKKGQVTIEFDHTCAIR